MDPTVKGVELSLWETDIFDDERIKKLIQRGGSDYFTIYVFLSQQAYKYNGYFCRWRPSVTANAVVKRMSRAVREKTVIAAVDTMACLGLFDKGLYMQHNILTSRSMQIKYLYMSGADISDIPQEIRLVKDEDLTGLAKCVQNSSVTDNVYLEIEMKENKECSPLNPPLIKRKEAKEKLTPPIIPPRETKENYAQNGFCALSADNTPNRDTEDCSLNELFNSFWKLYPEKKGKGRVTHAAKQRLKAVGEEQFKRCIDRYLYELEKDSDWRKPQNGSTFFNSGYLDYTDENYDGDYDKRTQAHSEKAQRARRAVIKIIDGEEVTVYDDSV